MRTYGMNTSKRRNLEERYGLRIIGEGKRYDNPDISGFLNQLKAVSRHSSEAATVSAPVSTADPREVAILREAA